MLSRRAVDQAIKFADKFYNQSKSPYEAELFAKLALIEICGWIEEAMDTIVLTFARKRLSEESNIKLIEDVTSRNYSFTYERNFRELLIKCVGIVKIEKTEKRLNRIRFDKMQASLSQLKKSRDSYAHTHVKKDVVRSLDAPSKLRSEFENVYLGLKDIANCLR